MNRGKNHRTRHFRLMLALDERETEFKNFIINFLEARKYHYDVSKVSNSVHGIAIRVWRKREVLELWKEYSHFVQIGDSDAEFLKGFFEGDGSVNVLRKEIVAVQNFNGKRKVVIDKLRFLGYDPYIYSYKTRSDGYIRWYIKIRQREARRFLDEIGFLSNVKQRKLAYPQNLALVEQDTLREQGQLTLF